MSTNVSDSSMSDSSQSCHELSEASEEGLEVVPEFQPYSDEPLGDDDADYLGKDEANQMAWHQKSWKQGMNADWQFVNGKFLLF